MWIRCFAKNKVISWDFSTFSSIWRFSLCRSFLASHYLAHLKQVLCRIFCNLIIIHKTSNWQKIRFTFIWNTTSRSLHPAVTSVRDRYYCWIWILPLERESWWSLSFKTLKGSGKILIKSTPPVIFWNLLRLSDTLTEKILRDIFRRNLQYTFCQLPYFIHREFFITAKFHKIWLFRNAKDAGNIYTGKSVSAGGVKKSLIIELV